MNNLDILKYYVATHDIIFLKIINAIMKTKLKGKSKYNLNIKKDDEKLSKLINKFNL
jgi:hypothetical protein